MRETLAEIKNSKRKITIHLLKKTECEKKEIKDIFKGAKTVQWINRILNEMNHSGLILYRTGEKGEELIRLDKTKIVVKRATDKFKPDLVYMLLILAFSITIPTITRPFLVPYISLSLISFMMGSVFSVMMIVVYFAYKIFKTPETMQFFYKRPPENT